MSEAPRAQFVVKGHPAPKGSRTFLGGKGASKESSDRCKPWVEAIVFAARGQRPGGKMLPPPYKIGLRFVMPMADNPKWGWPTADGDLDKLARAVLDALVYGGCIGDDSQVITLNAHKLYATADKLPGVSVLLTVTS